MSAEFRSLVELALSAPIVNPKLIMSCVDEDRELGDLHDWSDDVDSLVKAFESQGDCLLGLRSDTGKNSHLSRSLRKDKGYISWGAFMCIDQGGKPDELVADWTANKVLDDIHSAWMAKIYA